MAIPPLNKLEKNKFNLLVPLKSSQIRNYKIQVDMKIYKKKKLLTSAFIGKKRHDINV